MTSTLKSLYCFTFLVACFLYSPGQIKKRYLEISYGPHSTFIKTPKRFNHDYKSGISRSFTVDILIPFSHRSNFQTGISITNIKYSVDYDFVTQQPGDPNIPRSADFSPIYLEVPVTYCINTSLRGRFSVFGCAGFIFSKLIVQNDKTTFEDNSIRRSGYLSEFLTSINLGVGILYSVNEKISLNFKPQYRIFLSAFDNKMESNPSLIGVQFGLSYKLDN